MPATKIVATLGPSTDPGETLRKLFEAGVDVFRLNASHGTHEDHARRVRAVRELAREYKAYAGILLDLQGPKIRLGTFKDGPCYLAEISEFSITSLPVLVSCEFASTNNETKAQEEKPNETKKLADG